MRAEIYLAIELEEREVSLAAVLVDPVQWLVMSLCQRCSFHSASTSLSILGMNELGGPLTINGQLHIHRRCINSVIDITYSPTFTTSNSVTNVAVKFLTAVFGAFLVRPI